MKEVKSIKAEEIVAKSKALFFQIFLVTNSEILSWTKAGFHNAQMNTGRCMQLFKREEVVGQYYAALRNARNLTDGSLQLVEIPLITE